MTEPIFQLKQILHDVALFAEHLSGLRLRAYQEQVARSIVDSVIQQRGRTFVVIFPRQSGKNELQAQIECYLLALLRHRPAEIVKVSPTWKPQSLNAMRRLERVLQANWFTAYFGGWSKESGYIYRLGQARVFFLSASPTANIVGATAGTLLECDEAQEVLTSKWDKEINPMAASTNATRVFWGTAWTSHTLLGRELRQALSRQQQDGIQRVFHLNAGQVAQEVPEYGSFVAQEIEKLGRQHPFVRTQYFSEEIDAESGMFPPARRMLMQGSHLPLSAPLPGEQYAFLLDIAGEDEFSSSTAFHDELLKNRGRDSTALTVIRIDLSLIEALRFPRYQVVARRLWTGDKHPALFGQLTALVDLWQPRFIVCDNTGVGMGLTRTYGEGRLIPFTFNSFSKSKLGWSFLSVIETGRFQDYLANDPLRAIFQLQLENCALEILPGPNKLIRWGVPEGLRDPLNGELVHDDLLVSAALCAVLDEQRWGLANSSVVVAPDPLLDMDDVY